MLQYHDKFKELLKIKEKPNEYELKLFKKTKNYMKFISWIPGLKFVGICNSLSMYATKEEGSDIDLFIITAPNRLWSVRILVTIIFQILGVRRHKNKIKERFCLSFFITENAMDFSQIAIKNDIYLFYWVYYLKPILNKNGIYEHFIELNKTLGITTNILPNDSLKYAEIRKCRNAKDLKFISLLGDHLNDFFKVIFLPETLFHKKMLGDPFGLIVSEDILKFHDNDKRIEIRDRILNIL